MPGAGIMAQVSLIINITGDGFNMEMIIIYR
jgi:hypothetical protein